MSQAFRPREPARRRLLARVAMTETLLDQLHESGRLHVVLCTEASTTTAACLDGSGAILFLGASGRPVQLMLDDLVDPEEDRTVHFPSVTLTLRWRDEQLLVYAAPGSGAVDPWSPRPRAQRSRPGNQAR
jgi:hypothetical protein